MTEQDWQHLEKLYRRQRLRQRPRCWGRVGAGFAGGRGSRGWCSRGRGLPGWQPARRVAPAANSLGDVGGDLAHSLVIGCQIAVDRRHPARCLRVGITVVTVGGLVNVKNRPWRGQDPGCSDAGQGEFLATQVCGALARQADRVPDLSDLPGDEVVELVSPVRGGGQPKPSASGDLPHGVLEGRGRDMVAFVGDDKTVAGGQLADVSAPGEGLQRGDINAPAQLCPAAAKLPGLDAEELADTCAPLVGQGLSVDQNQRRSCVLGDHRDAEPIGGFSTVADRQTP